jgi:hypothetical protein
VFRELNNRYMILTHARNEQFLSQISYDKDTKIYSMTLTLLPHQIAIFPMSYKRALDNEFLTDFKIYNNEEIR